MKAGLPYPFHPLNPCECFSCLSANLRQKSGTQRTQRRPSGARRSRRGLDPPRTSFPRRRPGRLPGAAMAAARETDRAMRGPGPQARMSWPGRLFSLCVLRGSRLFRLSLAAQQAAAFIGVHLCSSVAKKAFRLGCRRDLLFGEAEEGRHATASQAGHEVELAAVVGFVFGHGAEPLPRLRLRDAGAGAPSGGGRVRRRWPWGLRRASRRVPGGRRRSAW